MPDFDAKSIKRVQDGLLRGEKYREIAAALNMPISSMLLGVKDAGYQVVRRLEPITPIPLTEDDQHDV